MSTGIFASHRGSFFLASQPFITRRAIMLGGPSVVSSAPASSSSNSASLSLDEQARALRAALWRGNAAEFQAAVLRYPDALSHPDKAGNTVLHHALRHGATASVLEFLLDCGADPGVANAEGMHCVYVAFSFRKYEVDVLARLLAWMEERPRE